MFLTLVVKVWDAWSEVVSIYDKYKFHWIIMSAKCCECIELINNKNIFCEFVKCVFWGYNTGWFMHHALAPLRIFNVLLNH